MNTYEYILAGTWNMDVNQGRVTNFTADMQVELYDGSNPHHQCSLQDVFRHWHQSLE